MKKALTLMGLLAVWIAASPASDRLLKVALWVATVLALGAVAVGALAPRFL